MNRRLAVVALSACLILGTAWISAQQPSEHEQHHPSGGPGPQGGPPSGGPGKMGMGMMGEKCAMMQKGMDDMEATMQFEQVLLDKLVHEMNTTTGSAKVDAMAAALNEIAAQSKQMHRMHTDMMQKMMVHMTEHMMQGMGPQAQKPEMKEMMMCPMMKSHGDGSPGHEAPGEGGEHAPPPADTPNDGGAEDHSAHHPPAQ